MGIKRFLADYHTQILCTVTACLSIISDSMQVSWSSPATPKLLNPRGPIENFDEEAAYWIERVYLIGCFLGLPLTILLVDKLGRKPSVIISSCTNMISWLLIALATDKTVLYGARFIGGLSSVPNFIAVSIYIVEIADKKIRGFLSSFNSMCGVLGIITMYSIGPYVSITSSAAVAGTINALQIIALVFMPESPYLLIKKSKIENSKRSLIFLRPNKKNVDVEFEEIKQAVQRQEKESNKLVDLFLEKGNRKAILIGCILYVAEHFGCVTIILMNLQTILESAEGAIPAEITCILFAIVTLISCIIGMFVIDKIGRKLLLFSSIMATSFFLASMATYLVLKDHNYDVSNFNWIPIVCIVCYGLCVKGGLEMVPVIITAELFPTNIKTIGLTFADTVYVGFSLITLYVYQILASNLGIYYPLYLYSFICAMIGVFVICYVPETNRKTLEEIQFELRGLTNKSDDS